MQYGEKIVALRKQHGMTQAELGAKLNVTFQAVSKWERGESLPDFETMSRIARLFGVPIRYFEEGGEECLSTQEKSESEQTASQPKMLGICRSCGNVVLEGDEAEREPSLICKTCSKRFADEKEKAEREEVELTRKKSEAAERMRVYERDKNIKSANRGVIWAAVIMAPIFVLIILSFINSITSHDTANMGYFLLGAAIILICGYTFVAQLFWDGIVRNMVLFGGKIVGMPGVIFSLDLDGIIFLIGIKILFAILKFLIFIVTLLLGIAVTMLISPFTFVPQLIKCRKGTLD